VADTVAKIDKDGMVPLVIGPPVAASSTPPGSRPTPTL
jgi:hypothetical protein